MLSLSTCPACNYTRQSTDTSPDWACPQCHKAYVKTNKEMSGHCYVHPTEKATWRCKDCRSEFCRACVKHARNLMPIVIRPIPVAVCPECGGECFDFQCADVIAKKQITAQKQFLFAVVVIVVIMLLFPLRYYLGMREGTADAKRELPNPTWHILALYGPRKDLPEIHLPVVTHHSDTNWYISRIKPRFSISVFGCL